MKVLAIVGSPRRKGNIEKLSTALLNGASEKGHVVEMVNLYDYRIEVCNGCWSCAKQKKCYIKDDFYIIAEKIESADVIVLASPIYWGNITGHMKTFFDRHTGDLMIKPEDAASYYKMSVKEKIQAMQSAAKNFGPEHGYRNKKYILLVTCTVPKIVGLLSKEITCTLQALKLYVNKMNGKVVNKLVFSDTLFRFNLGKKDKMMEKAYAFGLKL